MAERRVDNNWIGKRVEVFLNGDEHPRVGTLTDAKEDGIELAEEENPDPTVRGR